MNILKDLAFPHKSLTDNPLSIDVKGILICYSGSSQTFGFWLV
jgi:hypothetical protein